MNIIELDKLSRTFEYYKKDLGFKASVSNLFFRKKLQKEAVKEVSFSIKGGDIVGFIGPNGAGKTTTLKMLSGILHPTSGSASVLGFTPWLRKKEFKKNISIIMSQKGQLWPDLPAIECIYLTKCMYEVPDRQYKETLDHLVNLLEVKELLSVQVRRLSLGERMKIEIINSLIHNPKVIFLDEPTIGLDLITQQRIRTFFKEYNKSTGATIILTSHYMQDIEELCERGIIINHGQIVFDGPLQKINDIFNKKKIFKVLFHNQVDRNRLEPYGEIKEYAPTSLTIEVDKENSKNFIRYVTNELPFQDLKIEDYPLEKGIAHLYTQNRPLEERKDNHV